MLPLILLAASLIPSQQTSAECVDTGAQTATTQTQPVRGPGGVSAVLKVSTEDDHSKNSHECNADYLLLVTPAKGGAPSVVDIDTVDGSWGRTLSPRLDGFSQDGKHIFGIIAEGGKWPLALLFDYDTTSEGSPQLIDLNMQFARTLPPTCISKFGVIGTAEAGGIVLELNSTEPCGTARRWIVFASGGKPRPLSTGVSIVDLYESKGATR
jgi:hypothetical protein